MKACPYVYIKTGELLQSKCLYAQCMAYVPEVDTKLVNPNDKFQFIISKKHASCKLIESGDQPK